MHKFYDEEQGSKIKNEARERVEKKYGIGKKVQPSIVEATA